MIHLPALFETVDGAPRVGGGRAPARLPAIIGIGVLAASAVAFLVPRAVTASPATAVERRAWAMGTELTIVVEAADRATAVRASEAALRAIDETEDRISTWKEGSELSRLNGASPGVDFPLSPQLEADLREAAWWWSATDGAFDPGIARLVEVWDLRGSGRVPSDDDLEAARMVSGLELLNLKPGAAWIDLAGFGIEEGGFGKGIALRSALAAARAAGAECTVLNFGGQVSAGGSCPTAWVEIADPDSRHRGHARLEIGTGSVATSGNSERGLIVDGVRHGHILDPRSGRPAVDWGTVTVVADDPVTADCLSTALFVMGPQRGIEWLRRQPGIEAFFVESRGDRPEMTATAGLEGRLEVSGGSVEFLPPAEPLMTEDSR